MVKKTKPRCGNCNQTEHRVAGSLIIWQTVAGVRRCATCFIRYSNIAAQREVRQARADLNQLFVETHGGGQ